MDIQFYQENGYWIEPGVFTPEECDALVRASLELDNYRNGSCRPAMMPHRVDEIFLCALRNPRIVSSMNALVGGTPVGLQTEFFYCKPGTRGFSLHQDNFFVEAPAGAFASAWVALTDVTPENGGLIAYPGTHKEGLLPVQKIQLATDEGQDPNANNEECIVPPRYARLDVSVPKGAVFYIHGHLVHGSNPNASDDRWRHVLLMTYLREGAAFRAGKYAQRTPVRVAGMEEESHILPVSVQQMAETAA